MEACEGNEELYQVLDRTILLTQIVCWKKSRRGGEAAQKFGEQRNSLTANMKYVTAGGLAMYEWKIIIGLRI